MNKELLKQYKDRVTYYQALSKSKNKELQILSFVRLTCFISLFPSAYFLFPISNVLGSLSIVLLLSLFLFLVKTYIETEKKLWFYQNMETVNQNEINALNRNFQGFDGGNEFIDPHHDYSFDLDLYGNGSLFQFLNRTVTFQGKKKLSDQLNQTGRSREEITQKQAAIQELANNLEWRQFFLASKNGAEESKKQDQLKDILNSSTSLKKAELLKCLILILPPLTLFLILIRIAGLDSFSLYKLAILAQWVILGLYIKTVLKFHVQFENQGKVLSQYTEMLYHIEKLKTNNEYLNALKAKLQYKEKSASTITKELGKLLNQFDYSKNVIISVVLDSLLLWDIKCISRLNDWQQEYAGILPQWFEVIAEIDALISLANFNYNHPEWAIPIVSDDKFVLKAIETGHPLLDESRCVRNTFHMSDDDQITIITGANMAGKSTFLRTIGVNLVLASNGCKVFAESFEFSPIRVFTNMRTSDNLMNDESYFYAELLRLQTILKLLRSGEKLFVIIDEMLKGTNSIDKLNGSKELIKKLLELKTHGIVATHDLALTELANFSKNINNQCFEVELSENDLRFSYKLAKGVTKTMNATFLMKKMGIISRT